MSVEKSERLARELEKRGVRHEVLNAKQHTREAEIVTQAGRVGAVTVATNMAGRGVDILLGGNPEGLAARDVSAEGLELDSDEGKVRYAELLEKHSIECKAEGERVRELGGLYVLGTERHESRRIDNQLRGRSGRQGDPGESQLLPVARGRPHALLRDRAPSSGSWARAGTTTCRSRRRWSRGPSRRRRTPSRRATERSARTSSSTTRS